MVGWGRIDDREPGPQPAHSRSVGTRRDGRLADLVGCVGGAGRDRRMPCRTRDTSGATSHSFDIGGDFRGQPPRRRNVASVMGWAVEAVADYVENVRPKFGHAEHPALWMTERGGRIKPAEINARFVTYRDALGLSKSLVPHSMRHSYVSHLTEDGVDRRFIQCQVGHEVDSSTAVYTHVSADFMNTALRKALSPALGDKTTRTGLR